MSNAMHCPKCKSVQYISYGNVKGRKRYKCKNCNCQFTKNAAKGKTIKTKLYALMLYLNGLSMNMTGNIIGVSRQAVMQWIRSFDKEFHLAKEQGNMLEIELDKISDFIEKNNQDPKSKKRKLFIAKLEGYPVFILVNAP